MSTKKVRDFFNGRFFEIPKYQRGYAWEVANIRELFDDIFESKETNSSHYIGTIVLSKSIKDDETFYLVDGQQRIASITMIINAIIKYLSKQDANFYHRFYIKDYKYRLDLLGRDGDFFHNLLGGNKIDAKNKSQRLLKNAYDEIYNLINDTPDKLSFLNLLEKLEIMEFVENSEGDAIRIFQTVNDRGRPLSNMEKAKSLLVYFSNRYLNKKLDDKINDIFGEIFEIYDDIKTIGEDLSITPIKNIDFNEDSVMRYHFVTFSDENYDATAGYVLDFLKASLRGYRNDGTYDFQNMEQFIEKYLSSLCEFFNSFRNIIKKSYDDANYYRLFVILNLSATLYPLLVKLEGLGKLDDNLPGKDYNQYKFIDLIELIDVRIYKTRNTDPRADISRFAYSLNKDTKDEEIQNWLLWYNRRWMNKEEFVTELYGYIYGNRALPHIFIEYCEKLQGKLFTLKQLENISKKQPQVEHILSQKPKFTFKSHGFKNKEDFLEHEDTLGNLTVLEKSLNTAIQNKNPREKVPFYDKSMFKITKVLSTRISRNAMFKKDDITKRTEELAKFCSERWWC